MTPAIRLLEAAREVFQVHSYRHDPKAPSYGLEAAEALGVGPDRVFKTLVIRLDGQRLGVAMVPVHRQLDLKAAARAFGAKRSEMAPAADVLRTTGYVLGGVSPLGQKRLLPTLVDRSAVGLDTLFCSAGRRGLEIELAPDVLVRLLDATPADIAR